MGKDRAEQSWRELVQGSDAGRASPEVATALCDAVDLYLDGGIEKCRDKFHTEQYHDDGLDYPEDPEVKYES